MDAIKGLAFDSPLGWILTAASPRGLRLFHFAGVVEPSDQAVADLLQRERIDGPFERERSGSSLLSELREAVLRYFEGSGVHPHRPLDLSGGTLFQQSVWRALCEIPFGEVRTYRQIGEVIGRPQGARAVGQACRRNPIALVVPCHRVVASDGKLGGYSGGCHIKRYLLDLERIGAGVRPSPRR